MNKHSLMLQATFTDQSKSLGPVLFVTFQVSLSCFYFLNVVYNIYWFMKWLLLDTYSSVVGPVYSICQTRFGPCSSTSFVVTAMTQKWLNVFQYHVRKLYVIIKNISITIDMFLMWCCMGSCHFMDVITKVIGSVNIIWLTSIFSICSNSLSAFINCLPKSFSENLEIRIRSPRELPLNPDNMTCYNVTSHFTAHQGAIKFLTVPIAIKWWWFLESEIITIN